MEKDRSQLGSFQWTIWIWPACSERYNLVRVGAMTTLVPAGLSTKNSPRHSLSTTQAQPRNINQLSRDECSLISPMLRGQRTRVIFHVQHTTPGSLTGQLPVLVGVLCRNQKENVLWNLSYNHSGLNRRNLHYFGTQHHTFTFCRIHNSGLSKKQKVHPAHMASEAAQHEVPAQQSALQSKGLFFPSLFISSALALGFKEKEIDKEIKNKTTTLSQIT